MKENLHDPAAVLALSPFPLPLYLQDLRVPHLEQYFGLWCVQPEPFLAAVDRVRGIDLALHVAEQRAKPAESAFDMEYQVLAGGVALLELRGTMMKAQGSLSTGTSTVRLRRQVRLAAADPEVSAILLRIDSPGGTVAGTQDLADDAAAAAARKPLVAYIEDLGASAAYWVASQARRIVANRTALVGSIGTFAVLEDSSGAAAQQGIKVHVIRAGAFKGAAMPGTEVTREQLDEWQRLVDQVNSHFLAAVTQARPALRSRIADLADGRVHVGQEALQLGLIDAVASLDEVITSLSKGGKGKGEGGMKNVFPSAFPLPLSTFPLSSRSKLMNEDTPATPATHVVADYDTLVAACPGADEKFLCGQLAAKATAEQVGKAWMGELARRNQALTREAEEAKAKAAVKLPGVDAVGTGKAGPAGEPGGDAIERFEAAVAALMGPGKERMDACVAVAKTHPNLHRDYLLATNPGAKAQRLLREKFGN